MPTKITLNGEPFTAEAGTSVAALLARLELRKNRVAVEINREVVPKAKYDNTMLNDGDVVEVINFVGGG